MSDAGEKYAAIREDAAQLGVPLQRTSLRGSAISLLRTQIISGLLKPSQLYSIGDIAARLGTSPTPIREALLDLANHGLVELVRNRGFRIREMSVHDVNEIIEIRLMLEIPALQRLAALSPRPDLADAERACVKCSEAAEAGDINGFLAFDREFHLSLISKLGNQRLVDTVASLRDQTRLYGLQHMNIKRFVESAAEHPPILRAIVKRNPEAIERLMTKHLMLGDWGGSMQELG